MDTSDTYNTQSSDEESDVEELQRVDPSEHTVANDERDGVVVGAALRERVLEDTLADITAKQLQFLAQEKDILTGKAAYVLWCCLCCLCACVLVLLVLMVLYVVCVCVCVCVYVCAVVFV